MSSTSSAYLNETIAKASALPESFYPEFLQYSKESFEQNGCARKQSSQQKKRVREEEDDEDEDEMKEDEKRASRKVKIE